MKVKSKTISTLASLSVLVSIYSFANNPSLGAGVLAPAGWNMQANPNCPGGAPCDLTNKEAEKKTAKASNKEEKAQKKTAKASNKEEKAQKKTAKEKAAKKEEKEEKK